MLAETNQETAVIKNLERSKKEGQVDTGHVLRHNRFLSNIIEGKIPRKKTRVRPKTTYVG